MKYIKIDEKTQKRFSETLLNYPLINPIVERITEEGGFALLVGGAVRDMLLDIPCKDLDIEVHGLSLEKLEKILGEFGPVSLVGKAFGVLRLHGLDIDWSVPRTDSTGRKPLVELDPHMSIERAFARRDLTINAMGINIKTKELVDPFNGLNDLRHGILRAPVPQLFVEDPLRFFRVMQFVGRFEMKPDDTLNDICAHMDVSGVSRERIETEFNKLFLKSKRPSLGIVWLDTIHRLKDILPELAATKGIQQEPTWHPEGDVFEHTKQALDAAAILDYDSDHEKLVIMYAALCHDLGKPETTEVVEGAIKSYGHERDSEKRAKALLKRITANKILIDQVAKLVRYHMHPLQFVTSNAKDSAYKRLARNLSPDVTIAMLAKLALVDRQGRNPKKGSPLHNAIPDVESFLKHAQEAEVVHKVEEPILHGRDLMDVMKPGPEMGALLKKAYELQLEEGIKDKEILKKRILGL